LMTIYAAEGKPLLGPCRCRGCREPLFWARRKSRHEGEVFGFLAWREWTGRLHRCEKA
jgi:hypothetical protein